MVEEREEALLTAGLDVNFTKRERERILHERNYQLAFWVIMGHGGKQVSEKSRSELRRVVVEKKEAWGIFEYPESIRRAPQSGWTNGGCLYLANGCVERGGKVQG